MLSGEIGGSFTIESLTFVYAEYGPWGGRDSVSVYMGQIENNVLSSTFADNWIPGTRKLVAHYNTLEMYGDVGDSLKLVFDTPFWYCNSSNLLIEIETPDMGMNTRVYNWESGANRSCWAYQLPDMSGYLSEDVPYMILEGQMELAGMTFAGIKVVLGESDRQ